MEIYKSQSLTPRSVTHDLCDPTICVSDRSVPLCDLLSKVRNKLIYEYDFGDGWLHEVLLQKILAAEEGVRYPVCIEGKFAAPPEDSGGTPGYCDLLEALDDPDHEGHEGSVAWLGDGFDPEFFDLERIHRRLRRIKVKRIMLIAIVCLVV